jgi:predicted DNA-binding transcriptional regulator AlpA
MKLICATEAAEVLGIRLQRFYEMVRREMFPTGVIVRFGERQLKVNHAKLVQWIDAGGSTSSEKDE